MLYYVVLCYIISYSIMLFCIIYLYYISIVWQAFSPQKLAHWRRVLTERLRWCKPERPPKEGKSPDEILLPRSAAWLTTPPCRCGYEVWLISLVI